MKPFATTQLANPPNFEALCLPEVWAGYRRLRPAVQRLADEKYRLLKDDSRHPSLELKRIGRFWSCRVGLHHRTLGIDVEGGILWFWIGDHSEYDRIIG